MSTTQEDHREVSVHDPIQPVEDVRFAGIAGLPGQLPQEGEELDYSKMVLVHEDLFVELLGCWGQTNELEDEIRGLKKGMKKVTKRWQQEKREGRLLLTRTARKLRKARAGRDRRERQLKYAHEILNQLEVDLNP